MVSISYDDNRHATRASIYILSQNSTMQGFIYNIAGVLEKNETKSH